MKLLKIFILVFIFSVIIATPIILYILLTKPKYKCDTTTGLCTKDSSGKYNSLNDCTNNCTKPTKYKCDTTTGLCTKDSSGKYNSQNDCTNNCTKPTKYKCDTTTGLCTKDSSGKYNSQNDCKNNCTKPTKYKCDTSTGSCTPDSSGNYNSQNDCKNNCTKPTKYKCDTSTGSCTPDSSGEYNSLNGCKYNCTLPTITFTFEDGQTETFPYNIKNKYYTSRGILDNCPTNYPPPTDGKSFSMKNSGLPTKYTVSSNFPSFFQRIVMTGFNGATGSNYCDFGLWETSPGQDLKNIQPSDPSGSAWIWNNAMQTFRGDLKK